MTRLVIKASPLMDRWSVTSASNRDLPAWPPSPDTLFSALVAAAASMGHACHPALRWLEAQGNPSIEASEAPASVSGVKVFCPVADRVEWSKGARQARSFNSIGDASPVCWSWEINDTEHVNDICSIAEAVTYIGSSRSPVLATAFTSDAPLSQRALVPDAAGRERLRGLYVGRLDELEAAFQRGERPRPTENVTYCRLSDRQLVLPWGQIIPLRRATGRALYLTHSVPVVEAVRRALTRHLPDGAPGVLTGHDVGGEAIRAGHLAIVPLPRIDDRFADGELLGVGLLLPKLLSDADYNLFILGLGKWLGAGGAVDIGGVSWTMELAHDDHRVSLRPSRYVRDAGSWASVTPVVFDRHPRRTLSAEAVVADMCRDVGLPEPAHIAVQHDAFLQGAVASKVHALGSRDYMRRHFAAHVQLQWSRQLPGPIVLGRGRYFGMGMLLPVREAA